MRRTSLLCLLAALSLATAAQAGKLRRPGTRGAPGQLRLALGPTSPPQLGLAMRAEVAWGAPGGRPATLADLRAIRARVDRPMTVREERALMRELAPVARAVSAEVAAALREADDAIERGTSAGARQRLAQAGARLAEVRRALPDVAWLARASAHRVRLPREDAMIARADRIRALDTEVTMRGQVALHRWAARQRPDR